MEVERIVSKPLSLENYVRDWGRHLFKEDGITNFKVIKHTIANYQAQVVWLRNQLPLWVSELNDFSGTKVESAHAIAGIDYLEYNSAKVKDVSIKLELSIPGKIVFGENADKRICRAISGIIKKQLALDILQGFPPPFNPAKCMFAANSLDILRFHCSGGQLGWEKQEVHAFVNDWDSYFLSEIKKILGKNNTGLLKAEVPKTAHGGSIELFVEYSEEKSPTERRQIETVLYNFLNESGIGCYQDNA